VAVVQLFATEIPLRATRARIMAAMRLLHQARSSGAFVERPRCRVEESCVPPLCRECKDKCGSDVKRKLCACHVARASPNLCASSVTKFGIVGLDTGIGFDAPIVLDQLGCDAIGQVGRYMIAAYLSGRVANGLKEIRDE
jgi:hypothetical protein